MILLSPDRRSSLAPLLHLYWRVSRGMTLGVRACGVNSGGGVLLVRHSYTPGWHFPGGGVEVGQTLEQALADELRQEAHVELTAPPRFEGMYLNARTSRRDHVALYRVEGWTPTDALRADAGDPGGAVLARDALPKDTTRGTRERLAELFEDRPRSAHW